VGQDGRVDWTRSAAPLRHGPLAYARGGRGRPLLYLHDAGADTLASAAFDDLARDHDVVLLDLPGYGESAPPGAFDGPGDIAAMLASFLDHLGWTHPLVVGTSLGAWFALELAFAHPDRPAGMVLAGAAGLHCPEEYLLALFRSGDAAHSAPDLIAGAIWDRLPGGEGGAVRGAAGAAVWGPWVQELAAAAWCSWHPYTANPRVLAQLGGVRCPVEILWGERDGLIPLQHARLLADGVPAANLRVVDGAGHLVALDAPGEFSAAVRRLPA
jgi:pimeloyl-ACP methyl ester carboxylesterase